MKLKNILLMFFCLLAMAIGVKAENWDFICTSGKYYYGEGSGSTVQEAKQAALDRLAENIAADVSGDFRLIDDMGAEHKNRVLKCIKTYLDSNRVPECLTRLNDEDELPIRYYILRSDLPKLYKERIENIKATASMAESCMGELRVDVALQYYYWSHLLLRSLQHPEAVKDKSGRVLAEWLPKRIEEILAGIKIMYDQREEDNVDLLVFYKGNKPVSSLIFNYFDGKEDCEGQAKDGRGVLNLASGSTVESFTLNIDYEGRDASYSDKNVESLLQILPPKLFPQAVQTVRTNAMPEKERKNLADRTGVKLNPSASQTVDNNEVYAKAMEQVIEAITTRNSPKAIPYFTPNGWDIYNKLIVYGKGRSISETPNLKYYKGYKGTTVVRGLQRHSRSCLAAVAKRRT